MDKLKIFETEEWRDIVGYEGEYQVSNLEWCTNGENQIHAYANGLNYHSDESGRTKRQVCKIDLTTGEILDVYESISLAEKSLNLKKCNITEVCKGNRKSCGGYEWKYVEEMNEDERTNK